MPLFLSELQLSALSFSLSLIFFTASRLSRELTLARSAASIQAVSMRAPKWLGFLIVIQTMILSAAPAPETLVLWPQGAPEPVGFQSSAEASVISPRDGLRRVSNVSDPTLTIYRAQKPNGTAVLVAPGGGYNHLAIQHEGEQVCSWLNSLGVTAALLKYRVPRRDPNEPSNVPLQDAQRAMGILRKRASDWDIRPDRIGVLGFSAGGHLSIRLALQPNQRTYAIDRTIEHDDAAPNFAVPIYPAYLVSKTNTFELLSSIVVTDQAPPICLVHAHDDKGETSSSGSALIYLEYKKRNLPAELHIYDAGGHGFGMKATGLPSAEWSTRVGEWLRSRGLLDREKPASAKK
ncbi:MAG TPA: alpha/beta hydrolase [Opitutaceae bacterium]|nr:alpha/beta hydrolase [Opitutaceae bacterium]